VLGYIWATNSAAFSNGSDDSDEHPDIRIRRHAKKAKSEVSRNVLKDLQINLGQSEGHK
jgi:hypothetical protein